MGDEEEFKKAEKIALRMLVFRDRSEQEIRDKLNQKGFSASVTEKIITKCSGHGYLDDRTFAERLARSLFTTKNWGFARIGATLRDRGVSSALVKETILQLREDYSEEEAALQIMKRRFCRFDFQKASSKEKHLLIQFLRRRGFSWETISRMLTI